MSHLSFDRLAALADEQPTADEHMHLSQCAECARELDAHRSLLAKAGTERESMGLPLTRWETLSRRLRAEGLITSPRVSGAADISPRFSPRALLQIAATLLLVAGGAVLGRMSAGVSVVPGGLTGGDARQAASAGRASIDSLPTSFASVDEARRWKSSYEDAYQKTVSFLAANDSAGRATETPAVMKTRLSALDRVQRTMGEALKDAPYDPVINNYYLNSFGEREATLRMLNTVLPQGVRMNSF